MNSSKYKSSSCFDQHLAIVKKIRADDFRSVGKVIEWLCMQECERRNIDT